MSDPVAVSQQFVTFYYNTFDSDRKSLSSLYRPSSMLTFEGSQFQGTDAIIEKLSTLPFQQVKHEVTTFDVQPASDGGSDLLVMATGALLVDGSEQPLKFSQTFHLVPEAGSYYVLNDIFRLNY